jgi:hypothetical protein
LRDLRYDKKSGANMRNIMASAALLALGGSASAGEDTAVIGGEKLREAVSGKTVYLMTPIGAEIPIRYQPNGTIQGKISATLAALGGESVSTDTGRWWVVREQLCQQWKNWAGSRSHCYTFRIAGAAVQWQRGDGETGTARIASN